MPELSPEGEAIAAYGAATMAAVKILIICLQANGALEHGQFPEALRLYMEAAKDDAEDAVAAHGPLPPGRGPR